ncbi:hypothetical protein O7606_10285 [Micromonospora sp. WMMD882]|uniref:hypothetical protein n=1 Tax=Micromonospora sp. WMMD882 TaxID=3015151 RepID=UPI00248B7009|nr:hypothetical protein [Micromonospora sp. WMMD882]WBB81710.1 hypothetical protein O7606_10285 [Micromonospora sp. WMMD882]
MTEIAHRDDPLPRLAVPGERFGWIYQDRNLYRRRFPEPPPTPGTVPPELVTRATTARQRTLRRVGVSLGVGLGLAALFGCCGRFASSLAEPFGWFVMFLTILSAFGGLGGALVVWLLRRQAEKDLATAQEQVRAAYEQARAGWEARRVEFEQGQQRALEQMYEWSAAAPSPGTRRIDVVGGSSYGWEALLTVLGGSLLSTRGPMTLVDFTGEALCGELMSLAEQTRRSVRVTGFPSGLRELDLLAGLSPRELVDLLVESMHGAADGGDRAQRHQDAMLLGELCEVLGDEVTIARIVAGLRVLTDRPGQPALSEIECSLVISLLPEEARRQAHHQLRRLESFLRPLETLGQTGGGPPDAELSCLVADRDGRSAQHELLKDLLTQWLIRRVSREEISGGSIVLVGADELHHRQIERLGTLCERRGIRLVLFYAHLREQALHALGGGEVAFMRLGNHREAQQAAEFIGRQHKFVLSGMTRTLGGNETHTLADMQGGSETDSRTEGSRGEGRALIRQRSRTWSRSRNWSQTRSVAAGTTWNDAAEAQRVYEYAVEPRVLQDLPDYALLLVKGEGRGSVVQAVECNPEIVTLPYMTMDPVPLAPLPSDGAAAYPTSGPPGQVTLSQPAPIAPQPASADQTAAGLLPGWGAPAPGQQPVRPSPQPGPQPPRQRQSEPPPGPGGS